MYSLIVFLPLLGAIIAGGIALYGAMERVAEGPAGNGDDHHDAWGSRAAELITCSFMVIAALLSWIAFFRFLAG